MDIGDKKKKAARIRALTKKKTGKKKETRRRRATKKGSTKRNKESIRRSAATKIKKTFKRYKLKKKGKSILNKKKRSVKNYMNKKMQLDFIERGKDSRKYMVDVDGDIRQIGWDFDSDNKQKPIDRMYNATYIIIAHGGGDDIEENDIDWFKDFRIGTVGIPGSKNIGYVPNMVRNKIKPSIGFPELIDYDIYDDRNIVKTLRNILLNQSINKLRKSEAVYNDHRFRKGLTKLINGDIRIFRQYPWRTGIKKGAIFDPQFGEAGNNQRGKKFTAMIIKIYKDGITYYKLNESIEKNKLVPFNNSHSFPSDNEINLHQTNVNNDIHYLTEYIELFKTIQGKKHNGNSFNVIIASCLGDTSRKYKDRMNVGWLIEAQQRLNMLAPYYPIRHHSSSPYIYRPRTSELYKKHGSYWGSPPELESSGDESHEESELESSHDSQESLLNKLMEELKDISDSFSDD